MNKTEFILCCNPGYRLVFFAAVCIVMVPVFVCQTIIRAVSAGLGFICSFAQFFVTNSILSKFYTELFIE